MSIGSESENELGVAVNISRPASSRARSVSDLLLRECVIVSKGAYSQPLRDPRRVEDGLAVSEDLVHFLEMSAGGLGPEQVYGCASSAYVLKD